MEYFPKCANIESTKDQRGAERKSIVNNAGKNGPQTDVRKRHTMTTNTKNIIHIYHPTLVFICKRSITEV